MNPTQESLPLRDIHLPDPVGWWPPAIGWWLLLALLLLLVVIALWIRRLRARSATRAALMALDALQADATRDRRERLAELSIVLKRMALTLYGRENTAALTGDRWLAWLDEKMGTGETPFTHGPGRRLADDPYRPEPESEELDTLFELCRTWIRKASRSAPKT